MKLKTLHFFAGLLLSTFIALHLCNHLASLLGAEKHIQWMKTLRIVYRQPLIETLLIASVGLQIYSGVRLLWKKKKTANTFFEKLQLASGLYLALFFTIHLSAIFAGRWIMQVDTNFYFGAAGLNTYPYYLFFVPYYSFGVLSFYAHIAAIHAQKMKISIFGLSPNVQAKIIIGIGLITTIAIIEGLTNYFQGYSIPELYKL